MSTIVCAISGNVPDEPVFAPRTGHVYEKRIILKQIQESGKCPVTKEELAQDDLKPMKVNKAVRPRPASATGVPGMLNLLQSEWDQLMAETYEMKTNLDTTRKQLSHALYQHDAACRVIARLLRERDAARAQVAQLQEQLASSMPTDSASERPQEADAEMGLTPGILQRMEENAKGLSKKRKQRNFPDLNPLDEVKKFECAGSQAFHQSTAKGVLCVDVHQADASRIATGGVDNQVILYDAATEKVAQKLGGHSKKVTAVKFLPAPGSGGGVVSASQDSTVRVWTCSSATDWRSAYTCAYTIRRHQAEVTALSIHPLGEYLLTASLDKSWAISDLSTGRCVRHMQDLAAPYCCASFHPDGLILAGGTQEKTVAVWDIKEQNIVATLEGHEDAVETLSFSGNGYYLATGARDGSVKLWDLRKPLNIQTLKFDGPVHSVAFDTTGSYLAVGADVVKVFNFETKSSLAETVALTEHDSRVMGVCWGPNAKNLASVSMDHSLKIYEAKK